MNAYNNLGNLYRDQDKGHRARDCYLAAYTIQPTQKLWKLRATTLFPSVFANADEIDDLAQTLESVIDQFSDDDCIDASSEELIRIGSALPLSLLIRPNSNLSIKKKYASLFLHCFPPNTLKPRNGQPKLGIIVTKGHEDAFLRCCGEILKRSHSKEFDSLIFCSQTRLSRMTTLIANDNIQYVPILFGTGVAVNASTTANMEVTRFVGDRGL